MDDPFPFLSARQADTLRSLARDAFARNGLEVTVHPDHVVDGSGRVFGLRSLAVECSAAKKGEWKRIVREGVRDIIAMTAEPSPFETLTAAEILAATYPRLMAGVDLPPTLNYALDVGGGLAEVMAVDLPDRVAYFPDDQVERFGHDALRDAAYENLRAVEADDHMDLTISGSDGDARIRSLTGESMFIASLVLVLPTVLARHDSEPDPDLGAFVIVPDRYSLDVHVLGQGAPATALEHLATTARLGYEESGGDVSPFVYWWRPGRVLRRISDIQEDGRVATLVGDELEAALDRLA
ncbi:hypothetical protein ACQEVB_12035 [Pseudonocardia sp. CA-107938]|uniref:hypothetical protein n=1 Tax=Pseudonocardia sp. CA-107938 TaxID=3240021 RepID=UPI003D8DC6AC